MIPHFYDSMKEPREHGAAGCHGTVPISGCTTCWAAHTLGKMSTAVPETVRVTVTAPWQCQYLSLLLPYLLFHPCGCSHDNPYPSSCHLLCTYPRAVPWGLQPMGATPASSSAHCSVGLWLRAPSSCPAVLLTPQCDVWVHQYSGKPCWETSVRRLEN